MNCKNCNAVMKINTEKKLFTCPYCGSVEAYDSTSKEEIEQLLKGAVRDANKESKKMMESMMAAHRREMAIAKTESTAKKVATYVVLSIAAIFTLIMTLFGFDTEYKAVGVVSLIQFVLIITAIIAKAANSRERNRMASILSNSCIIAAALLVVAWIVAITITPEKKNADKDEIYQRDYYWPEEGFASSVPRWGDQPDYAYVGEREFDATILDATEETFSGYVEQCKKDGFTIDATITDREYNAYNEAGQELNVDFISSSEIIYIDLYDAIEWSPLLAWPTQGYVKDVPRPDAEEVFVSAMGTNFFEIYVNDMPMDKFMAYVEACTEAGFEGRYENDSHKFWGQKGDASISLELKRGRVMLITVY